MMCLATVYVDHNGQKEEVMHGVAWIKPGSHGLQLITLMGESRLFQANIKSINLVNGSIILEKVTTDSYQKTRQKAEPA
jgi:predicted RNA-binding protein